MQNTNVIDRALLRLQGSLTMVRNSMPLLVSVAVTLVGMAVLWTKGLPKELTISVFGLGYLVLAYGAERQRRIYLERDLAKHREMLTTVEDERDAALRALIYPSMAKDIALDPNVTRDTLKTVSKEAFKDFQRLSALAERI